MNRLAWEEQHGQAALAMLRSGSSSSGGVASRRKVAPEPALVPSRWAEAGEGVCVPVLRKTDCSFDARANARQRITLAAGIETESWVSGVLVVRLHAKNTWSATAVMSVVVENVSLVPEDPSVVFLSTAPALATASFTNTSAAPSMNVQTATGFAGWPP